VDGEREAKSCGYRAKLVGIDATAWDEIQDVFGDGTDYTWASVMMMASTMRKTVTKWT